MGKRGRTEDGSAGGREPPRIVYRTTGASRCGVRLMAIAVDIVLTWPLSLIETVNVILNNCRRLLFPQRKRLKQTPQHYISHLPFPSDVCLNGIFITLWRLRGLVFLLTHLQKKTVVSGQVCLSCLFPFEWCIWDYLWGCVPRWLRQRAWNKDLQSFSCLRAPLILI